MIAITIDLDWAPDEVIRFTFDLLDTYHVRATVFCTHKVDIGIHEPALHPGAGPGPALAGRRPSQSPVQVGQSMLSTGDRRRRDLLRYPGA